MCGSPSGAVARNHEVGSDGDEFVEGRRQDWFKEAAGEMQSSNEPVDVFDPGHRLDVTQDVDDSRVTAAGQDDETLVS